MAELIRGMAVGRPLPIELGPFLLLVAWAARSRASTPDGQGALRGSWHHSA